MDKQIMTYHKDGNLQLSCKKKKKKNHTLIASVHVPGLSSPLTLDSLFQTDSLHKP